MVEEHADLCLEAGINFEGINQEVACGQWEFQIFAKGAKRAGDELWVARYLLDRLTESYGYYIEYHPKPIKGDWNGSGMHANFSNGEMRDVGGKELFDRICEAFGRNIDKHMAVYGAHNEERLTGLHETRPNRLINSHMEFPTVGHPLEFQHLYQQTVGSVDWKIAGRPQMATHTRLAQ